MRNQRLAGPLNSTTTDSYGGLIRPTELERCYGRLLRSPEGHDPAVIAALDAIDPPAADPPADPPAATDPPAADPPADPAATVLGSAVTDPPADPAAPPAADPPADPVVVPETYDLKLTVAGEDGKDQDIAIDTALLDLATPVFKDVGLTNEQAQKVTALVPKVQERLLQQQNDAFAETRTAWAKQAQEDPEIGGQNWKSTLNLSARALDHFVGPVKNDRGELNDFRQLLDDTGLGNHPAMIRFCRKVGEGLAEDGTLARGSEGPRAKPSRLEALYPDDVKK